MSSNIYWKEAIQSDHPIIEVRVRDTLYLKSASEYLTYYTCDGAVVNWGANDEAEALSAMKRKMAGNSQGVPKSVLEELALCKVDGLVVKLPIEHLNHFQKIKKLLLDAGGVSRGSGEFHFEVCPEDIMARLLQGERVNFKQVNQFFETGDDIAQNMIDMADIEAGHRILEPSAGRGAIADKILYDQLVLVEKNEINVSKLQEKGYEPIHSDFLELDTSSIGYFDRIIANPPFSKNQDIHHVLHMYDLLKVGGCLVSVMSAGWQDKSDLKSSAFRKFLRDVQADVVQLPKGTFGHAGTSVATVLVKIQKV